MIIPNPSPKVRFNESKVSIEEHHRILEHPSFQRSCDAAMLQLQVDLLSQIPKEQAGNFNAAAAAHLRLQGAHEFLTAFRKLTDTGSQTVVRDVLNLDHKAQQ